MPMKKLFIFVLVITLFSVIPVNAIGDLKAEEKIDLIQPQFTNISVFYNDFKITENGKAILTSSITARDVDEIRISTYLQQYKGGQWTIVKHWTTTQYGTIGVLGETWYVSSGYQYRMVSYGYVYNDDVFIESTSYTSDSLIY